MGPYVISSLDNQIDNAKWADAVCQYRNQDGKRHRVWEQRISQAVRSHQDLNIRKALDVGCGIGRFFNILANIADELVALDISEEMLEHAAKHQSSGKVVQLEVQDAHCLPFPDCSFDLVFSSMVLGQLSNVGKAIKEMFRVCSWGGIIVIRMASHADINSTTWYHFSPELQRFDLSRVPDISCVTQSFQELGCKGFARSYRDYEHIPKDHFLNMLSSRCYSALWCLSDKELHERLQDIRRAIPTNNLNIALCATLCLFKKDFKLSRHGLG